MYPGAAGTGLHRALSGPSKSEWLPSSDMCHIPPLYLKSELPVFWTERLIHSWDQLVLVV